MIKFVTSLNRFCVCVGVFFCAFQTSFSADPYWLDPILHDYKMSVCEIVYSAEREAFDVKLYLYTDDFKVALTGKPNGTLPNRDPLIAYIFQHLEVDINGQRQLLSFYAFTQKEEQVLFQFSTQKVALSNILTVVVKDSLLLETFKEQTNMVYVVFPKKSKMVEVLDAKKTEGQFSM